MNDIAAPGQKLMCMNLQMLRASHVVLKTYDDAYRPYGIRATQLPVLSLIAQRGPITIKEIAEETVNERSVLSRKLQIMEKHGWIREESGENTREKSFCLTREGQDLLDSVMPVRLQVQEELLGRLSEDERRLMLSLCDKLRIDE